MTPPSGRSRVVPLVGVVVVFGVVLAVGWLVTSEGTGGDTEAAVIDRGAAEDALATGSGGGGSAARQDTRERLAGEDDPLALPEGAGVGGAAGGIGAVTWASRRIEGRVVAADGHRLPGGLRVHARKDQPAPIKASLSDGMGMDLLELSVGLDDDVNEDTLPHHTLAEVARDGTFAVPDFPETGAWLVVEHRQYYTPEPLFLGPDELAGWVDGASDPVLVVELGATLTGVALDADDEPLEGIEVAVGSKFDPWMVFEGSLEVWRFDPVTTDARGRFEVGQIPPGIGMALVAGSDVTETLRDALSPFAPGEVREVPLVLHAGAVLAGVLRDEDDEPIPHAELELLQTSFSLDTVAVDGDPFSTEVETDEDGRFRIGGLAAGTYELNLDTSVYTPTRASVELARSEVRDDLELVAYRGLELSGRVLSEDGLPIENAHVFAYGEGSGITMMGGWNEAGRFRKGELTETDGSFTLGGFEEGEVTVEVTCGGYSPVEEQVEAGSSGLVFTLAKDSTVSGIVVSLVDGDPVTGFMVSLVPTGGVFDLTDPLGIQDRMKSAKRPRRVEHEEGVFSVGGVRPGTYDLEVRAADYAWAVVEGVEVKRGKDTTGVVVMLEETARITGELVDKLTGEPIPGAKVVLGAGGMMDTISESVLGTGNSTITDEDGRFELSGLGQGKAGLTITHKRYRKLAVPPEYTVPGEVIELGRLAMGRGATIHGHVYDEQSRAVPGVLVMASDALGTTIKRTTTDGFGAYRIEGLPPGMFNVMRLDFQFQLDSDNPMDVVKDMVFRTVNVEEDGEHECDLAVDSGEGTTLTGYVRAQDGPAKGALLSLVRQGELFVPTNFTASDERGYYELTGIEPGPYTLFVIPMDNAMASQNSSGTPSSSVSFEVTVGAGPTQQKDVDLPGARVEGVVRSKGARLPLSGVRVLLERVDEERTSSAYLDAIGGRVGETYTDENGKFAFRYLPDGTYDVVAGGQNLLRMGKADVAVTRVGGIEVEQAGLGFPVRVEVEAAGAIAGTVTAQDGTRLDNVAVWARDETGRWVSTLSELATDAAGEFRVGSLGAGRWTLAFARNGYGLTLVEGLTVRVGETTEHDVVLPPGIDVFVDPGGIDLLGADVTVSAGGGSLPTELVSLTNIAAMYAGSGPRKVGSLPAGSYSVAVVQDGETIFSQAFTLAVGDPPLTLGPIAP